MAGLFFAAQGLQMVRSILDDLLTVQRISAVPAILQVVSETTGLRFAAVARVTETNWTACAVLDRIEFGLNIRLSLKQPRHGIVIHRLTKGRIDLIKLSHQRCGFTKAIFNHFTDSSGFSQKGLLIQIPN